MDVGILGPLVVRRDGHDVTIGPAMQRGLLVLFLLHRGEIQSTDALIDALWDDAPPATAVKIVHGYVSQLRKVLGPDVLETRPGGYLLRLQDDDLDATTFEALLARGRAALKAGDARSATAALTAALALWRGPPLIEFRFRAFAANEINRLTELHLLALEANLEAGIALGHCAESIIELQALVRAHPLHENLQRLLMLALYRAGRQAEALSVYRQARRTLIDELGVEPGPAMRQLEAAILAHDPVLESRPSDDGAGRAPPDRIPDQRRSGPTRRRTLLVPAALAAALVVLGFAVLAARPGTSHPATAGPDSVDFIAADGGRLTDQVELSGPPAAIALGAGSVWAIDTAANTMYRVDPGSPAAVQTIPTGLDPRTVTFGGGSAWVTNHDDNTVSRVNPQTDTVVQKITTGAGPSAVAYGYGAVWVTNALDRTLTRIDPATGRRTATIATNAVGAGIAIGGGSVWVSDEATNRVIGVDPATNTVQSSTTVGSGPTAVAFGADSVWVVNALDETVSRVDAKTLTVRAAIPIAGGPVSITVAGGSVWVGAQFGARVVRIDPARNAVTASIPVGNPPVALAPTPSGVWIAAQPSGLGHRGGRLVVVGDDSGSIDPGVGDIYPQLAQPVYDALTAVGSDTSSSQQIVPDLAVSLPQPTDDGKSYAFRLRSGVRYSNGEPVRAIDFRRALERLLTMDRSFATEGFIHIVGAAQCIGRAQCDLSRGVIVQGSSTITLRLTEPDPRLFEELLYLAPVPAGTPSHDVGTKPVPATGPYYVDTYVPGRLITLERNRYFRLWSPADRPDGYPDEIVYEVVPDPSQALRRVIAGKADLVDLFSVPSALPQFAAAHPAQVHVEDQQAVVFVFLNVQRPPFSDVRVRRALNYAVDRDQLVSLYGASLARPTCQLVPPSVTGYRPYCPYTIDPNPQGRWSAPDLAKALSLVRASGTRGEPVVLWAFPDFVSEARYVVGVLDRLGYPARVHEIPDSSRYFDVLQKTPAAQAGMFGWFGALLAVDNFATVECSYQPNPAHFCDHRIDAQIDRLAVTEPTDPGATRDLAAEIDREITDEAPWVPLLTPRFIDVTNARVGDYKGQLGVVQLDQLWVR